MNPETIRKLAKVEDRIRQALLDALGVDVEVTIREDVEIYTEDMTAVPAIVAQLAAVDRPFLRETRYPADEHLPEGITLFFPINVRD